LLSRRTMLITVLATQRWRNLPGEIDPKYHWQGFFAAPSRRRMRSAAGSG
jgi:hypothetical protein